MSVAFSPDGKTIVSGSDDNTLIVWDVDPESWIRRLCTKLPRNLTRAEWKASVGTEFPYAKQCPRLPEP